MYSLIFTFFFGSAYTAHPSRAWGPIYGPLIIMLVMFFRISLSNVFLTISDLNTLPTSPTIICLLLSFNLFITERAAFANSFPALTRINLETLSLLLASSSTILAIPAILDISPLIMSPYT